MENENRILTGLNINLDEGVSGKAQVGALVKDTKTVTVDEVFEFNNNYKEKLKKDSRVLSKVSSLEITNTESVLNFGEDSVKKVNAIFDKLLHNIRKVDQEDAGEVLVQLSKIMQEFNIAELDPTKIKEPSFFKKMFKKVKNSIEEILDKYDTLGKEVDKIHITLKKYEKEIIDDARNLKDLYNANIDYYKELEQYIVAGELILEELDNEVIPKYKSYAENSNDSLAINNYNALARCRDMVDQRIYDLKIAENIALQSLPMIQQMQMSNFELVKTIKSSFIITLPIFKQCLINAVSIRRRALMAENIGAIKNVTEELMRTNSQNVAQQCIQTTQMSGVGAIDINVLEESYKTILDGIKATEEKQLENRKNRKDNSVKLDKIKYEILHDKNVELSDSNPNINKF